MANPGQGRVDFIGTRWGFPLRVNGRGGIDMSRGASAVEEALFLLLSTPIGERRMRPDFGCGIHDFVFATNDPTTHGLIRHQVLEAIALWEPRVEVVDVRVWPDPDEPARVLVDIDYALRATNERRNLVYPFYVIPGEE
ncbi:MAG: GPW/gp25 family protein [Chloroflexi bacterium]|nr:GPW/gp25 family protein [Chloroflexota bacterium]